MAFQYPVQVPGVSNSQFLRLAYNEKMKHQGEEELDPLEFNDYLKKRQSIVEMSPEFFKRSVNEGFLGRREKAKRDLADGGSSQGSRSSMKRTSGLDIDLLLRYRRRGRQQAPFEGQRRSFS